jgi:hypothetical protein
MKGPRTLPNVSVIEAPEIAPSINIRGMLYSTVTGYAQDVPEEPIIDGSSEETERSPDKPSLLP